MERSPDGEVWHIGAVLNPTDCWWLSCVRRGKWVVAGGGYHVHVYALLLSPFLMCAALPRQLCAAGIERILY